MITAILIDDEEKAREGLKKLIEKYAPDIQIIGMAENVEEGAGLIKQKLPDLVFLDVEMPNGNGFTLFDKCKGINFQVIFTTAFEEYAIKAFRYSAIDYLTKPIDFRMLQEAIAKFRVQQKMSLNQQRIEMLLDNISNKSDEFGKIALPTAKGYEIVKIKDILYCKADGNYCNVHFIQGNSFLVSRTLQLVEELLPEATFYRIHKSHLVNINLVKRYDRQDHLVMLEDGTTLDVAERNKKDFITRIAGKELVN